MVIFIFNSGKRSNVDVTSSGAFFDPRAVSKKSLDGINDPRSALGGGYAATTVGAQSDIITQLTREMKLQQGSGNVSGLFSGSSDANVSSSSSGLGSSSHLNQLITSQISNTSTSTTHLPTTTSASPSISMSQQIISQLQQDAAKLSKMNSGDSATGKLPTTAITSGMGGNSSGSSGYKSGGGGVSGGTVSGEHSYDNSLNDLTGIGKAIKSSVTTTALTSNSSHRLPLSSTTSLLMSNNSSITSLNATSTTGIPTSSLVGHNSLNVSSGITNFTSALLQQQQQLDSTLAVPTALSASSSGGGGETTSLAIRNGKKLAPDKLPLLSRSQPDLFTGIDGVSGLAAAEGTKTCLPRCTFAI